MADESHSFSTARTRLEEIVTQVRKKDTSLEKSLDLLEEGVRLANSCTELIDHADWVAAESPEGEAAVAADDGESPTVAGDTVEEAFGGATEGESGPVGNDDAVDDDGYDDAWADDETPTDEPTADDDPSADER